MEHLIHLSTPLEAVAVVDAMAVLPRLVRVRVAQPSPEERRAAREHDDQRRLEEDRDTIRQVLASLMEVGRGLCAERRQSLEELERAAIELAITVASRVVHEKVTAGDYGIESLVREAVGRLGSKELVSVRLHPEDLALLGRRLGAAPVLGDCYAEIRFVPDASLRRGECRAEAGELRILSQIEEQLAGIHGQLLRSITHAEPGRGQPVPADRELRPLPDGGQPA